jgi:hypothetical protein
MKRGFSIPLTHGLRGSGLGNEVIPWAKAFIASQEFGLQLIHPAWGLNARRYNRDFSTSRADWLGQRVLRIALPTTRITEHMVRETGEHDYALALRALANDLNIGRRGMPSVVLNEGMSGGYYGIQRARDFLQHQLMRPEHVARDLYLISEALDPERLTVAVHVRARDFASQSDGPTPAQFNMALPGRWYEAVIENLDGAFGESVQYLIVSDANESELKTLIPRTDVIIPPRRRRPLLSDLFSMVNADVLLCSVSSFSMLAAFLSERPYVWFEPHLGDHRGWRSLWGHEESQQAPRGLTAHNIVSAEAAADPIFGRGVAVGVDGRLPEELLQLLEQRATLKKRRHDLLYYGVIHTSSAPASTP